MKQVGVAAVGIVDKDLLVLRSLLALVGESRQVDLPDVGAPERAQLIFLGHLPADRLGEVVRAHGHHAVLVYCCTAGEPPPAGVRTLAHCPPRLAELAHVVADVVERVGALAPATGAPAAGSATAGAPPFEAERSLAGAIQARLPRILIDQPLLIRVPDHSPVLVDVRSGVRLVHAEPGWFAGVAGWRVPANACEFVADAAVDEVRRCRRLPLRPLAALRYWGILAASDGRAGGEWPRWASLGLKKMPDFATLPHLEWHPILARQMVGQWASPSAWAHAVRRPLPAVHDFLNAAAAMGWLVGRTR